MESFPPFCFSPQNLRTRVPPADFLPLVDLSADIRNRSLRSLQPSGHVSFSLDTVVQTASALPPGALRLLIDVKVIQNIGLHFSSRVQRSAGKDWLHS